MMLYNDRQRLSEHIILRLTLVLTHRMYAYHCQLLTLTIIACLRMHWSLDATLSSYMKRMQAA